jgi:hypothetical protein
MRLSEREPHWISLQGWAADDPFIPESSIVGYTREN